jgi:hypothetical protein
MDIATFRANFPLFADTVKYPDTMITFWSTIGEDNVALDRWGGIRSQAVELYTAHHLIIASDSNIGKQTGLVSNKSIGDVSVGYDTSATLELNAGHWNTTMYGKMFIRLARMYGAGCVQL